MSITQISSNIVKINVHSEKLTVNPEQDRIFFDQDKLKELAENIKNHGLEYPITIAKHPQKDEYTIIDGERRWRAFIINWKLELDNGDISQEDDYPIDARVYYPKNEDEYSKLLFIGMDNGNEQREAVSPIEKGVSYREKIRPKRVSGRTQRMFKDLQEMTSAQLGFNKIKKDLSESQTKIFTKKYKDNSKYIRNASTTHYIEDQICENNGIDDRFLILKLTQLSSEYSLPSFGGGNQRLKDKEKLDLEIEKYGNLTESEVDDLEQLDYVKYEQIQSVIKKTSLVNEVYDDLVKLIYDGTYSLDDYDSYQEWRAIIEEKIAAAIELAQVSKEKNISSGKREYRNLGSSYSATKRGCKLELDFTKIDDPSVKMLVDQLLNILENRSKQD